MTLILGISAYFHDSAAVIVCDGRIVAAAQEERFTRIKHDSNFPENAVAYCLKAAGVSRPEDLDFVAFYEKPYLRFSRLVETYLGTAPHGYRSFLNSIPLWLKSKLWTGRDLRKRLGGRLARRIVFPEHHESHAASAFFPSPFDQAAILTVDGVGEWATASIGVGEGNQIRILKEQRFPHSLGLLYSAFTYYCGFRVNSGEYKLMGLAPYGKPRFRDLILRELVDLKEDGSFRLNMKYFAYCYGETMTSPEFHRLFGGPPRTPETELQERDMDLAASVQAVTNDILLRTAHFVRETTGMKNLCLAGGVALNCVANGKIAEADVFDGMWIQPASGDAGGALGCSLLTWYHLLGNRRTCSRPDSQSGSLLGPEFSTDEIRQSLDSAGAVYHVISDEQSLLERVAEYLANECVVGWFQGRMEFGPRALGARSILGDARSPSMQSTMNLKIKFRESFRPFAPAVLQEHCRDYFDCAKSAMDSPYMLMVASIREECRLADSIPDHSLCAGEAPLHKARLLKESRSVLPAVTHVDYSARIQTVNQDSQPRFRKLIETFYRRTGTPVLINTSFNVRGEPIVCTAHEAYRCFVSTKMDVLCIGDFILLREEQPQRSGDVPPADYLQQFALD
ncbi:MAG: carbamoyltransferase [Planctomyces sp.]|nr:carbamoyltransferase [Planctomyces sp.]